MEVISVAAVAANGVIGRDGEIPWPSIPGDKEQYRGRIADWPVIIGRQTFDSMRDDLPGSAQIVLSRTEQQYDLDSAYHASGVDDALDIAEDLSADRVYVIGGGEIYALFQPVVDRMILSRIPGEYPGDTNFPEWDEAEWTRIESVSYDRFALETWVRSDEKY